MDVLDIKNKLKEKGYSSELISKAYSQLREEAEKLYNIERDNIINKNNLETGFNYGISPDDESYLEEQIKSPAAIWGRCLARCAKLQEESTPKEKVVIDKKKLKERGEAISKVYNLEDEWLKCFAYYSFNNEAYGKALFYNILSVLAKKVKTGAELGLGNGSRVHIHSVTNQESGSGKDRGLKYLKLIIKKLNKIHEEKHFEKLIKWYSLTESNTYESFLDRPKIKKATGKPEKDELGNPIIISGIFSDYDMLLASEANFLIGGKEGTNSKSLRDAFLQALEGEPIEKSLVGWDDLKTYTVCDSVFVGVTRPFDKFKMSDSIINSGLQQRGLNITRKITDDDQMEMWDLVIKNRVQIQGVQNSHEEDINNLVQKLYSFYEFMRDNNFKFVNIDGGYKILKEKLKKNYSIIINRISNDAQKRSLKTFISRMFNISTIIAVFNAAIRKSNEVELVDEVKAYDYMSELFTDFVDWVGENIAIDSSAYKKNMEYEKILKSILRTYPLVVQKKLVVNDMMIKMNSSYGVIVKLLKTLNTDNKFFTESFVDRKKMLTINQSILRNK